MNLRALMSLLPLIVRLLRQINELRRPQASEKRPAARKAPALRPAAAPPRRPAAAAPSAPPPRRRRALGPTLVSASAAGIAAYLAVRQAQRRAARLRAVRAPFPEELLDVLAPPGGAGNFFYTGEGLIDVDSDAFYPVIDGIPDFGGPRLSAARDWLPDVYDLLVHGLAGPLVWQGNHAGVAALAGAVGAEAYDGWCLSAPCGTGLYEIEMARANPQARFVCVDASWGMLLEARRKALAAGLANLYFVRGDAELLPVKSSAFESVWSAHGLAQYAHPERAVTQLTRAARPGALVAGVTLVPGGPPLPELALRLFAPRLPGLRDIHSSLSLLSAAGLRELRAVRDGAMVRFHGTRAA